MNNTQAALIAAASSVNANVRAISGISWPTTRDKIYEHAEELEAWLDAKDTVRDQRESYAAEVAALASELRENRATVEPWMVELFQGEANKIVLSIGASNATPEMVAGRPKVIEVFETQAKALAMLTLALDQSSLTMNGRAITAAGLSPDEAAKLKREASRYAS